MTRPYSHVEICRCNRTSRLFIAMLLLISITLFTQASADSPKQTGLARIAGDNVRLREEPVSGKVIAYLPNGGCVYVYDQTDDAEGYTWYHVNAFHHERNMQGWIRSDLLILPNTLFCDLIDVGIAEKHIIALKSDGSVIAGGSLFSDVCSVEGLYNAVNVDAGWYTSFVFFEDGTYWAKGRSVLRNGEGDFRDLATASVLNDTWAAIRKDGSYFTPDRYDAYNNLDHIYDASHLENVKQIAGGFNFMVCLTEDGKAHVFGLFKDQHEDVESWENIVKISANQHVVGLKADGTVVASGENLYGECDVSEWTDIKEIAAGEYFTIGIRKDGTAIATGSNASNACNVGDFADIIQIEADRFYCVGRTSHGTLMFAGDMRFLDQSPLGVQIVMSSGE